MKYHFHMVEKPMRRQGLFKFLGCFRVQIRTKMGEGGGGVAKVYTPSTLGFDSLGELQCGRLLCVSYVNI